MNQTTKPPAKTAAKPNQEKRTNVMLNGNISRGILIVMGLMLGGGIAINGYLATTLLGHISNSSMHEDGEQKANRIRVVIAQEMARSAKLQALTKKNTEQDVKIEKLSDQLDKILQSLARVEAKLETK